MSLRTLLYIYIIGGLTFIPLVLVLFVLVIYYTSPEKKPATEVSKDDPGYLVRDGDEKIVLKTGTDDLAEKFHRKHESDVAAGYFAVCREYVPGGVNGKPPEKLSPAGDVVAQESPSIYQNMYRSIFERVQKPSIEPGKDVIGRRSNNVFYVVLRHGHLMLYDDVQQLEVRYVISLEYHDVDVYGGGDEIPEAELWIKRNSIRLQRKKVQTGDKAPSRPFFLFSENQSEKEDFYFAMLNNIHKNNAELAPQPQEFETPHIITLVQRLHSSEEHLQTRWLNAVLGRFFLAMYKTPELEALIRQKLTKKISRVKKPDFITKLALQKIDTGTGAPFITNPRLRDLTVNGDCTIEADIEYSGGPRIEIAATVRIDLGTRLKAREVDIVLAATCRKLSGHILVRFKPPPSNRIWVTFEKVPKVDMKLEPIVSSRQITYGFILRTLENRILEVIAETIVLPFWDDVPFTHTEGEAFRGGIWEKQVQQDQSTEIKDEEGQDEAEASAAAGAQNLFAKDDRVLSMPILADSLGNQATASPRKSVSSLKDSVGVDETTRTPERTSRAGTPRILRSSSFASGVDPMVSPSHAPGEAPAFDFEATSKRDSMLKDLSARSFGTSPDASTTLSQQHDQLGSDHRHQTDSTASPFTSGTRESRRGSDATETTLVGSIRSYKTDDSLEQGSRRSIQNEASTLAAKARNYVTPEQREKTIASINAAKEAAQKWSWGVLARNRQRDSETQSPAEDSFKLDPSQPMGRGQPLPPPGQPLPKPAKPSIFAMPKRRPLPPPYKDADGNSLRGDSTPSTDDSPPKPPPPPLPDRRRRQSHLQSLSAEDGEEDEIMVVKAPAESPAAPASPEGIDHEHLDEFFGHGESMKQHVPIPSPPELPKRELTIEASQAPRKKTPPPLPRRRDIDDTNDFNDGHLG